MKLLKLQIAALMILMAVGANAQDQKKDYLWSYPGKNKTHTLGMYGSLGASYSPILGRTGGNLQARLGLVFNHRWTVGLSATGIWYDYRLNQLVTDGTYHLESGYAGIFGEYMQPLGSKVKLGFSLMLGQGVALYKYDNPYLEDHPWYERKIDECNYSVTEPGIEIMVKLARKCWLSANASYRFTSPVRLKETRSSMLSNFTSGIAVKVGLF